MYDTRRAAGASAGRASSDLLLATLRERSPDLRRAPRRRRDARRARSPAQLGMDGDRRRAGRAAPPSSTTSARSRSPTRSSTSRARSTERSGLHPPPHADRRAHPRARRRRCERVAPLVRSSHERLDGGGYPDRLAGEEIPLGARIVAVCDACDAMRSRPLLPARRSAERRAGRDRTRRRHAVRPGGRRGVPRGRRGRLGRCGLRSRSAVTARRRCRGSDAPAEDGGLAVNLHPLPGRPAVRVASAPRQLVATRTAGHRPHAEAGPPRARVTARGRLRAGGEVRHDGLELRAMVRGQRR